MVLGELILRLCEVLLLTILLLHLMLWKVAILGTVCILTIPYYTVILAHSSRFGAVDRKSMKKRWLEDDFPFRNESVFSSQVGLQARCNRNTSFF